MVRAQRMPTGTIGMVDMAGGSSSVGRLDDHIVVNGFGRTLSIRIAARKAKSHPPQRHLDGNPGCQPRVIWSLFGERIIVGGSES
jgi:hypothetical protein